MSGQQVAVRRIDDKELEEFSPTLLAVGLSKREVEKFKKVVAAAVNQNPDLAVADRRSLWNACQRAASDGLMPDGNECVLNVYNTKDGVTGGWVKKVQYLRMTNGLLKLINASPAIKFASHGCVFRNDKFRFWKDSYGEHIEHEPDTWDRGDMLGSYAFASTMKGGNYAEVLSMHDIGKIRACSKTPDKGPWVDWFEEKSRGAALKRLSKRLPLDIDISRDEGEEETMLASAPAAPEALIDLPSTEEIHVYDQYGEVAYAGNDRAAADRVLRELKTAATDEEVEALKEVNGGMFERVELDTEFFNKKYREYVGTGDKAGLKAWLGAIHPEALDYVRSLMADDRKKKESVE